jgi:Sec-independent protein secretion pathway component TatC
LDIREVLLIHRRKKLITYIVVLVFGLLLGGLLGELVSSLLPEGVVKDFFVTTVGGRLGPGSLDLIVLSLTAGIAVKLNVMSLIGLLIAAYLFRVFL